jgi:hypothetical protein
MKLSPREKVIVLFLPAVLICAVYGWFFYPARQAAWTRAVDAMRDADAKSPGLKDQVLLTQAKLALANRGLQNLQSDKQRARQAWEQAAAHCTDPLLRNQRIANLNHLLALRGLRVIEDAEAVSGKDGKVPAAVEGLCQELASMSGQHKPQVRKVRMVGRYLDVLAALDDLATREMVAIPVGLMMKEAPLNYIVREWVLLVWI